ncbi:tetratricopeptide repeat protein [Acetobacter sacchari]|uniref:Tetratricopeptide repeat protein n=1 Tax=Acetobacter sacchari TaxID=2661687 RepID=A0ABS3LTF8_9PROT|nr:tetratricopeptide repeat protein [Acetobacter sacchari]MBO1359195.1 tetratricopeptide repeat protein [Acetobacter sacchari]
MNAAFPPVARATSDAADIPNVPEDQWLSRAMDCERAGDLPAARRHALRSIGTDARNITSLMFLARVELALGRAARAVAPLKRAARLRPVFAIRLIYARCLRKVGQIAKAQEELDAAVADMPQTAATYTFLGLTFENIHEPAQAAVFYRRGLAIAPDDGVICHRLGRLLNEAGSMEEGCALLERAQASRPASSDIHLDHSVSLANMGRFHEALDAIDRAVGIDPDNYRARHNKGHILLNLNRSHEAIAEFDRVLQTRPEFAQSRFSRASALLKTGAYEEGWREYEWRWKDCQTMPENLPGLPWQGESLAGRSLLLFTEQGFGDSLQFIRFAPELAARGAQVTVLAPPSLARLLGSVDGVRAVISEPPPRDAFAFHCPLASLPYRLGITLRSVPAAPYLSVAPILAEEGANAVQALFSADMERPEPVVGLVWSGAPRPFQISANLIDRRRSMHVGELAPLTSLPGVHFASFQFGTPRQELHDSKLPIIDVMQGVSDFADTAARLLAVDLLIAVDTSIVHLAGGLGAPVWTLSRFDGCWRWLEERPDTPWYPSMTLIRQSRPGDWAATIAVARDKLEIWRDEWLVAEKANARKQCVWETEKR